MPKKLTALIHLIKRIFQSKQKSDSVKAVGTVTMEVGYIYANDEVWISLSDYTKLLRRRKIMNREYSLKEQISDLTKYKEENQTF